jgi:hypothetical protein
MGNRTCKLPASGIVPQASSTATALISGGAVERIRTRANSTLMVESVIAISVYRPPGKIILVL